MPADLDTLLTALYVFVDDQILPPERRRPGRPKRLTDAELVCLAVAQVMLDCPSQADWLRFCYCRLGGMFPYLPKQPGHCKRINAAGPLLDKALHALAAQVSVDSDAFRFIDAMPVPCGTSRPTRQRSDLAGRATYGYCASHSRWYWGLKLYLVTTAHGMPATWRLADPKLGDARPPSNYSATPATTTAAPGGGAHRRQGLLRARLRGPGRRVERALRSPRPTR